MAESHSNGKSEPSSPYKKTMDRPLSGIALFGPRNELFGEMKNRLKLRSTGHSDTKESTSEMSTNNSVEQQEPSSYDTASSSTSANSSPRSSICDFEQSESKTVSDNLLNRARKPPTRKPTLDRCLDLIDVQTGYSDNYFCVQPFS
ncbi:unnamed protein product [Schistosoma rodhaini]|uniref:Uncharacterized protein n=1 Tax=Schistosoma rodhaini TaxID=6188 RepID=A0AA85GHI3_9TREM|nr:unnamed protein product [Schistosoma rodhaini]